MERRRFDFYPHGIPVIGQGTWYLERCGPAGALATLRHGLDLGMNHIDTAELYGGGDVEDLVGEAIAGRRDEVFLVSKVMPQKPPEVRTGSRTGAAASLRIDDDDDFHEMGGEDRTQPPLEARFSANEGRSRVTGFASQGPFALARNNTVRALAASS